MFHEGRLGIELFEQLCKIDEEVAARVRANGCRHCGGRLDRADYPRKARGLPEAAEAAWAWRISLCCAVHGCRRRATPPSVRFLGRRVYAAAWVVMAVVTGACRVASGAARRTVKRWARWWRELSQTRFWQAARGQLAWPVEADALPGSLLERFSGTESAALVSLLRFVAPMTTGSVSAQAAMAMM